MARQVLPLIDFRTQAERQGISRTQQTMQAIADIVQTLGLEEEKRRERQRLDRITRAIAGGATTIEAITAAAGQGPEFSGGFSGGLQRFAGMFQPQTGGGIGQSIPQFIIGERLRQALMPKAEVPRDLEVAGATVGPEGGLTTRYAPPELPTPGQPFTLGPGQTRYGPQGEQIAAGQPKPKVLTEAQELAQEGYSPVEIRLIRDISHGIKPRASSAKQYENMSDVEKMDFLSKLKQRAEGQYYGVLKGEAAVEAAAATEAAAEAAVAAGTKPRDVQPREIQPRQAKLLKWVNEELAKLPMLQQEESEEPEEPESLGPPYPAPGQPKTQEEFLDTVKSIEDDTFAKEYYDKWLHLWQ